MFYWNMTRMIGTLQGDLYIFLIISLWILLRMRNVSDRSSRENQNTHFMYINGEGVPKIVSFMRIWKTIAESDGPQMTV
jgi:hypothetical protein